MRPYVICHMGISVDGRIIPSRWNQRGFTVAQLTVDYEALHEQLGGTAWLVGRVTMQDFAQGEPRPGLPTTGIDRGPHFAARSAKGYAIGIDAHSKLHYHSDSANGNHIVSVLSEVVPDAYLAELRASGISYLIAGRENVDLGLALEMLRQELSIETLLLEGGGAINGAFLKAGLIDELSLLVSPAIDGMRGIAALFDFPHAEGEPPVDVRLSLKSGERREADVVWLRYKLDYGAS